MSDNPALSFASQTGRPVVPVFILDEAGEALGAAPKWRLEQGLKALAASYGEHGVKLILRRGNVLEVLNALIDETGATAVVWNRLYDPKSQERDSHVKTALKEAGRDAKSFAAHLMFEPWTVSTGSGSFYRVYSPFWKAVRGRDVKTPLEKPASMQAIDRDLTSDQIADWGLASDMQRGAEIVSHYARVGERAAQDRLAIFVDQEVQDYDRLRDIPSVLGTSGLSENLALGEISPQLCWHAVWPLVERGGTSGTETFLKELVWREFAYHLMYHTPHILEQNWRPEWDKFPWNSDEHHPHVLAWKQGRTGVPFVDAAMREMYVTGRMHNRGRMIVASYLTKHLMTDWRIGQRWFEQCLIDWDPASNAMGWQWSAGSGPDATPYFRIFNAETQLKKFDPKGTYVRQWIAELSQQPSATAEAFFEAIPKHWQLSANMVYPDPIVTMAAGREVALSAYKDREF